MTSPLKSLIIGTLYRNILKPMLFKFDAENVHDAHVYLGEYLGNHTFTKTLTRFAFDFQNKNLEKDILGIKFKNPIGLAAGFDYNGRLVNILPHVGFGYSTVGTVTNLPYEGNPKPRLGRLPKSQSLLVNKGFKNDGVEIINKRLMATNLKDITFGVSVGSSNVPQVNTISKAIDDYLMCFSKLMENPNIKYFELNISCPNTAMPESFTDVTNFKYLLDELVKLKINKPIFVKMPNELAVDQCDSLVKTALAHTIRGFIFSNLVKSRTNTELDPNEIQLIAKLKGNFSGKPTAKNSNVLIKYFKEKYGNNLVIIGCGGVFSYEDALEKLTNGADLVQMITGMIYRGPQIVGEINYQLSQN